MSLPTREQVLTLDYTLHGQPFASVAAKSSIDLDGLDYVLDGQPFWGLEFTGDAPSGLAAPVIIFIGA